MDSNKLWVLDSNVILKWLMLETEHALEATQVRRDFVEGNIQLLEPGFCFWEVANYLGRNFDPKTALSFFNNLRNYKMEEALLTERWTLQTFQIMKKYPKVSFYDASYHALALTERGIFLTDDEKYYKEVRGMQGVRLLKDYALR